MLNNEFRIYTRDDFPLPPDVLQDYMLRYTTDIFALGLVMFEILSSLPPLPSDLNLANKFIEAKIPLCTKEVLRTAWEKKDESLLPGINNPIYDEFYNQMILCIDDNIAKRPEIEKLILIVKNLYITLLNDSEVPVYDESEALKRAK